ncbi:hypothetical protein IscW_ISCW005247, partial [Ixodes scapularis]
EPEVTTQRTHPEMRDAKKKKKTVCKDRTKLKSRKRKGRRKKSKREVREGARVEGHGGGPNNAERRRRPTKKTKSGGQGHQYRGRAVSPS